MNFDDSNTESIIGAIIRVHQELGPGFLESLYQEALCIELKERGHRVQREFEVRVYYQQHEIGVHRLDLFVDASIVVELKTVRELGPAQYAQVRSYLRATGAKVGLLVNFAGAQAEWRRIENESIS